MRQCPSGCREGGRLELDRERGNARLAYLSRPAPSPPNRGTINAVGDLPAVDAVLLQQHDRALTFVNRQAKLDRLATPPGSPMSFTPTPTQSSSRPEPPELAKDSSRSQRVSRSFPEAARNAQKDGQSQVALTGGRAVQRAPSRSNAAHAQRSPLRLLQSCGGAKTSRYRETDPRSLPAHIHCRSNNHRQRKQDLEFCRWPGRLTQVVVAAVRWTSS